MEKKDFKRLIHTWMKKTVKKPQYIMRRKKKRKGDRKKKTKGKREKIKNGVFTSHSIRVCPRILLVQIYAYNSFLQRFNPRSWPQIQISFFSCTLQIYCSGFMGLGPFLFWIQVKSGPYTNVFFVCIFQPKTKEFGSNIIKFHTFSPKN